MASIMEQEFPDEEEDDFNPAPEIGSDDEGDGVSDVKADADEDEQSATANRQRSRLNDADEDEDEVKDQKRGTNNSGGRAADGEGEDEEEEQLDRDEDDEDEDEDDEDEDDDIVRSASTREHQYSADHVSRELHQGNAGRRAGAISSSMSKPRWTKKMRKNRKRTMICQARRCTPMTCRSYLQARTETTANTASSIGNANSNCI